MPGLEAFVSLVTNDSYGMGAIALGRSLRDVHTHRRLALLITNNVSAEMRNRLSTLWDELVVIEELDSGDVEHLALLTRPELGVTFSKIHAWRLIHYSKCVFLDADTLVLQNVDDLFDREELSAAPDIGWPDCFNTGVFVFEPSMETFRNLMDLARQSGSFDGGDQGLLNLYWGGWATKDIKYHLPFIYNVVPNVTYGYAPAFQRFGRNAKIIHFIGPVKPWQHRYLHEVDSVILSPGTYSSQNVAEDFIRRWWQVYCSTEQPVPGSDSGWGGPVPGLPPPPHPLYSDPHIFTHPYHPSQHNFNLSYLYIPPPPTSIDNFSSTVPDDTIVYNHHLNQFRQRVPLDHLSDTSTAHPSLYVSYSYHAGVHYAHGSLSFYSPHDIGSTENDDGSHWPIVTDSVLPYYKLNVAPFSPPHFAQDQGRPGAAMFPGDQGQEQHRRNFEAGKIDYTGQDRFFYIQQHLDSVLRGDK